ncbi:MAG: hypothetical protein ATN35_05615 [Epulopiscium sp. Nele67-Bin004]|nr:MAG: hypothetical protein ATN35_05615 [Epulopiscium sp. Nele67-Bin004]
MDNEVIISPVSSIIGVGLKNHEMISIESGATPFGTIASCINEESLEALSNLTTDYAVSVADKKIRQKQDKTLNVVEKNFYISDTKKQKLTEERESQTFWWGIGASLLTHLVGYGAKKTLENKENMAVSTSIVQLMVYYGDIENGNKPNNRINSDLSKVIHSLPIKDKQKTKLKMTQRPTSLLDIKSINFDEATRETIAYNLYGIYKKTNNSKNLDNLYEVYDWLGYSGTRSKNLIKDMNGQYADDSHELCTKFNLVNTTFLDILSGIKLDNISKIQAVSSHLALEDHYEHRRERNKKTLFNIGKKTTQAIVFKNPSHGLNALAESVSLCYHCVNDTDYIEPTVIDKLSTLYDITTIKKEILIPAKQIYTESKLLS